MQFNGDELDMVFSSRSSSMAPPLDRLLASPQMHDVHMTVAIAINRGA